MPQRIQNWRQNVLEQALLNGRFKYTHHLLISLYFIWLIKFPTKLIILNKVTKMDISTTKTTTILFKFWEENIKLSSGLLKYQRPKPLKLFLNLKLELAKTLIKIQILRGVCIAERMSDQLSINDVLPDHFDFSDNT